MKVDPQSVATGYRTSKVVGSTVVNEANETVGTIDDLIVTPNEKVPFAVLSVGGFLGMGTKYVVVSYSSFVVRDKQMVLPGATDFPEVATRTPEEVLAIHGLHRGRRQVLDPAKGLVIVSWQRSSKPA